ncbi:hypothetical protein L1887_47421 [Cichorium endivia]|nr:hypothetical protein L1887_47421 [Cichorium endivia]
MPSSAAKSARQSIVLTRILPCRSAPCEVASRVVGKECEAWSQLSECGAAEAIMTRICSDSEKERWCCRVRSETAAGSLGYHFGTCARRCPRALPEPVGAACAIVESSRVAQKPLSTVPGIVDRAVRFVYSPPSVKPWEPSLIPHPKLPDQVFPPTMSTAHGTSTHWAKTDPSVPPPSYNAAMGGLPSLRSSSPLVASGQHQSNDFSEKKQRERELELDPRRACPTSIKQVDPTYRSYSPSATMSLDPKTALARFGSPFATSPEWSPLPQDACLTRLPSLDLDLRIQMRFSSPSSEQRISAPPPSFHRRAIPSISSDAMQFEPVYIKSANNKETKKQILSDGFQPVYPGRLLVPRDVSAADWARFLDDIVAAGALTGKQKIVSNVAPITMHIGITGFLVTRAIQKGMKKRKSPLICETIENWQHQFFCARGLDVYVLYNGERLTARSPNSPIPASAYPAHPQLQRQDSHTSSVSSLSSSSSSSSDSSDDEDRAALQTLDGRRLGRKERKLLRKQRKAERKQDRKLAKSERKHRRNEKRNGCSPCSPLASQSPSGSRPRQDGARGGYLLVIAPLSASTASVAEGAASFMWYRRIGYREERQLPVGGTQLRGSAAAASVVTSNSGVKPQTTDLKQLEQHAKAKIKPEAYAYVAGSASTEATAQNNLDAFKKWHIVPSMLRDVSLAEFDSSTRLFGRKYATPLVIAPIGVQAQLHPEDADCATACAAAELEIPFTLSSATSRPLEQVYEQAGFRTDPEEEDDGGVDAWFQLYWPQDDELTENLLARAKKAGYRVLVVTLDTWSLGWRPRDLDTTYNPFLTGEGVANVFSDPVFVRKYCDGKDPRRADVTPDEITSASVAAISQLSPGISRSWADLAQLRRLWGSAPIVLKGIQTLADAARAVEAGMDANGQDGVRDVLKTLLADLELNAGLAGFQSTAQLSRHNLVRADSRM